MRVRARIVATAAVLLASALLAACSSGGTRYASDPAILKLARQVPFPLLAPRAVPDNPPLSMARVIVPPPGPGPRSPSKGACELMFGHSALIIGESNGLQPPPQSDVDQVKVVVDPARHLVGRAFVAGYAGAARHPEHSLYVVVDGVQVQLQSATLSPTQLTAVAAGLRPVGGR